MMEAPQRPAVGEEAAMDLPVLVERVSEPLYRAIAKSAIEPD